MWLLYNRAKKFAQLPSTILHIEDSYVAYCVDEAVDAFGSAVESKLGELKKGRGEKPEMFNMRKQRLLVKLLEMEPSAVKYATPVATK